MSADTPAHAAVPFGAALRFWLKLGCIGFGGPAGQIALLHAELVERRRWISEGRFLHALNYCMLLPGPEAQQLATYLGWLMHGRWGGLLAGALFVLPGALLITLLAALYMAHGQQPLVAAVFAGLKPAVVALVLHAAWRLRGKALRHAGAWALAAGAFAGLAVFELPFPLIVAAAALVGAVGARVAPAVWGGAAAAGAPAPGPAATGAHAPAQTGALIDDTTPTPPHARFSRAGLVRVALLGTGLALAGLAALALVFGPQGLLVQMAWFFTKAALLTFGGAYAVLPYVHQGAVEHHQWLSAAQMMDALALGETTPGPLILVVSFVAFVGGWLQPVFGAGSALASGAAAAGVVTFFTFLPSFVFIFAGAPLVEATRGRLGFTAPLAAITAAVVGVILHLALFFAVHVAWPRGLGGGVDGVAVAMAIAATVALVRFKVGVLPLLAACAGVSLVLTLTGLRAAVPG